MAAFFADLVLIIDGSRHPPEQQARPMVDLAGRINQKIA
jgi:hypothetical protein